MPLSSQEYMRVVRLYLPRTYEANRRDSLLFYSFRRIPPDYGTSIALGEDGGVYISGVTQSPDLPGVELGQSRYQGTMEVEGPC